MSHGANGSGGFPDPPQQGKKSRFKEAASGVFASAAVVGGVVLLIVIAAFGAGIVTYVIAEAFQAGQDLVS